MKKIFLIFLVLIFTSFCVFAQDAEIKEDTASNAIDASEFVGTAQIAMSNHNYKVTAGDVYSLNYAAGGNVVSYTIPVDSSYKIRISNLAVLDASGKSYLALKKQVEEIVTKNYPMSGVQFVLLNPATFKVTIMGEVHQTTEKNAWALTRLSSVLGGVLTNYSSIRDITITSSNGVKRTYDLFRAQRLGEIYNNPYLRPDDVITINRIKRKVTISGAVERPGTYELMKNENLKTLIDYYGNGLTELADTSRIELNRNRDSQDISGNKIYLNNDDILEDYKLNNGDEIHIANYSDLMPTITVEGIIKEPVETLPGVEQTEKPKDTIYIRIVQFHNGENYATLARRISGMFNDYSDLANAYFERDEKKYSLNIQHILSDTAYMSEYTVQKNDKLVIPFLQHFANILVNGEVTSVQEVDAWPLKRLSVIIDDKLTEYSSTRDITITSIDGQTKTCDLFLATRFGDFSQNPYVRSGETVTINRYTRKVTIDGAVERPGTYILKDSDNLKELIEYYGNGLKEQADTSRIELTRIPSNNNNNNTGNKIYLTAQNINENYKLDNYDYIYINSLKDLDPVMFLEGAVNVGEGTSLDSSNKIPVRFKNGENYAFLVRRMASHFGNNSDLKNAYIIRNEEIIPLDLNLILYDASYYSTEVVQKNDILVIPFRQYFITVAGAVKNPGRYPYIPNRDWEYYIGLAGGFISTQNNGDAITIRDINGNKLSKREIITPECTITAKANSFLYFFNQYAPIITTILSTIGTVISIISVSKVASGQ